MTDKNKEVHDYHTIKSKPIILKDNYIFFRTNFFFNILSKIVIILFIIFSYFLYGKLYLGLRIKNKKGLKVLKNEGHILMSNHMHQFDAIWIGCLMFPKKLFVTMLQSNLGIPFAGKLFRYAGAVPIPEKKNQMFNFLDEMKRELSLNKSVLVMPEAAIKPYNIGIRKFFNGGFRFASISEVNILPLVYVYKNRKGLGKLIHKKPRIELHVLTPYLMPKLENERASARLANKEVNKIMSDYFNTHSDLKDPNYENSKK